MKKLWVLILLFVIILGVFYKSGYRTGTIIVSIPMVNTDIFIDQKKKVTTEKDSQEIRIKISPGEHQIIIAHAGYFPWAKKFEVKSGEALGFDPILVTQNATGEIITRVDLEYENIRKKVTYNTPPTKDKPRISQNKEVSLWLENNIILIKTGGNIKTVIAPESPIKNLEFYKNRSDAVIFSAGENVFVIETDANPENIQNIFPIFKGTDPHFTPNDLGSIYVLDGATLMAVVI
jgi:hypothetical protein